MPKFFFNILPNIFNGIFLFCFYRVLIRLFKRGNRADYHIIRYAVRGSDISRTAERIGGDKQKVVLFAYLAERVVIAVGSFYEHIERAVGACAFIADIRKRFIEIIPVLSVRLDVGTDGRTLLDNALEERRSAHETAAPCRARNSRVQTR